MWPKRDLNVTVPVDLWRYGLSQGWNFSNILTQALMKMRKDRLLMCSQCSCTASLKLWIAWEYKCRSCQHQNDPRMLIEVIE